MPFIVFKNEIMALLTKCHFLWPKFSVRGGFNSEERVKTIRSKPRLTGTDAASWHKFRAEFLDCQKCAAANKR